MKFKGAKDTYKPQHIDVDTRRRGERINDWLQDSDNAQMFIMGVGACVVFSFVVPLLPLLTLVSCLYFLRRANPTVTLIKAPYRVPTVANAYDGSVYIPNQRFGQKINGKSNKSKYIGKGVTYLGAEANSNMQVWSSDSDDRTHAMVIGSTGSGKSELLYGLIFNQLVMSSGAIVIDAKGDISFGVRCCNMLRRLGREDDFLFITFSDTGQGFGELTYTTQTNSINLFEGVPASVLIELMSSLVDSGGSGGGDVWLGRCLAFIACITRPLVFLRDKKVLVLSPEEYMNFMDLKAVEEFVVNENYLQLDGFKESIAPLEAFLQSLAGYQTGKEAGTQEQKTTEQYGYVVMQLNRALTDLAYSYGHIFGKRIGDIDVSDVVLNRRVFVTLLNSITRSQATLIMIARLLISCVKQMMASGLGAKLNVNIRQEIDSRPTNADNSFKIILDEVGYMMIQGIAVLPAQARSLNIAMVFATQSYDDLVKGSKEEAEAIWSNTTINLLGRMTSGQVSQTWEKFKGLAGNINQGKIRGYNRTTDMMGDASYQADTSVDWVEKARLDYEDIASQEIGQFTLISPIKSEGGDSGGVAISHFQSMYVDSSVSLDRAYVNEFVPVVLVEYKKQDIEQKLVDLDNTIKALTVDNDPIGNDFVNQSFDNFSDLYEFLGELDHSIDDHLSDNDVLTFKIKALISNELAKNLNIVDIGGQSYASSIEQYADELDGNQKYTGALNSHYHYSNTMGSGDDLTVYRGGRVPIVPSIKPDDELHKPANVVMSEQEAIKRQRNRQYGAMAELEEWADRVRQSHLENSATQVNSLMKSIDNLPNASENLKTNEFAIKLREALKDSSRLQ